MHVKLIEITFRLVSIQHTYVSILKLKSIRNSSGHVQALENILLLFEYHNQSDYRYFQANVPVCVAIQSILRYYP